MSVKRPRLTHAQKREAALRYSGVIVLDKQFGETSNAEVIQARRMLGVKGIGHCGTLDPLASGILVLAVGRARRIQDLLMSRPKEYLARIRLGAVSATDDSEGPIREIEGAVLPTREQVEATLSEMCGEIMQRPPTFSAIKRDGQRAWKAARRGRALALDSRSVRIDALQVTQWSANEVELQVATGKGAYVRALARDLGEALGCGGYLAALQRTRACGFTLADAISINQVAPATITPLERALASESRVQIDAVFAAALAAGAVVPGVLCGSSPTMTGEVAATGAAPDSVVSEVTPSASGVQAPAAPPLFGWVGDRVVSWVRARDGGYQSRALLAPGI